VSAALVVMEDTALATADKQSSTAIAKLDKARMILLEAKTLPEVLPILSLAGAAKDYAKRAQLGREAQNYAAEIAVLAACKAGEILKQLGRNQGERTDKLPANVAGGSEYSKTLEETGTAERTAQYWQKIAEVPEDSRSAYFARVQNADNGEITVAGLLRAAPHAEKRKHRNEPVDDFEDVRRAAIKMLNVGHCEMKKTEANHSLLDSAKTWAQCKLQSKETT
jgi:hypothetical protein